MKYKVTSITGNEVTAEQCHPNLTSFATVVMSLGGVEAPYPMTAVLKSEYFATALYPGMVIEVIDEEVKLLPSPTVGEDAEVQLELVFNVEREPLPSINVNPPLDGVSDSDLRASTEASLPIKPIRHGK